MTSRLNRFKKTFSFNFIILGGAPSELLMPEIIIDAEIRLSDIKKTFYDIISQMEPFGPENYRPVFIVRNVLIRAGREF